MRVQTLVPLAVAALLVGCGGSRGASVASRCSDYGRWYAKHVARRFSRPDQQRAIRGFADAYCMFHAQRLKMPSNPTDAEWDKVLKILNPPAVTIRRTMR